MRNIQYILFATVLMAGIQCKKDDTPVRGVDLVYRQQFEIFAGLSPFDVHHFYIRNINSRFKDLLTEAGKNPEDIIQVITVDAALNGEFGDADLGIIDRISIRAYDEDDASNYLEIAYRDPTPPDSGNSLPLIPSLADSKDFFSKDKISLDVVIWLRGNTLDSYPVQLDLKMRATHD